MAGRVEGRRTGVRRVGLRRMLLLLVVAGLLALLGADLWLSRWEPLPTQVVGMPPESQPVQLPAYQGPLPALMSRPVDSFPYPITLGQVGPLQPLYAGPLQYPFLCETLASALGQPLVDNLEGWGVAVYDERLRDHWRGPLIGYSKDCLIPTRAEYFYRQVGTGAFLPWNEQVTDADSAVVNGQQVPFVVRLERGVINRFLYMIAVLRGADERLDQPNGSHWNRRLIYQFRGGVGIGRRQGRISPSIIFKRRADQLAQGYAVLYSSGTHISNHYHMWRAAEVAERLKRQFVALYGAPLYTVGIGGSGGAIQQYLLAQNSPGLLDGLIAEYAYPDMVTQTSYAMDCELLEYYFDVTAADQPRWRDWSERRWVQGVNANHSVSSFRWFQRLSQLRQGVWPNWQQGQTECVNGWRGLTPLVHNPRFFHKWRAYAPAVYQQVHWTHWNDLANIYGTDAQGYGNSVWDNVGVQYGLGALISGQLGIEEFMHLNRHIGGWKPAAQMRDERFWFLQDSGLFPLRVSVWSDHNMLQGLGDQPAPRSRASLSAIEAAYRSGHVFLGRLSIPVLDVRHYLEPSLDMHHLVASFATRQRLLREQGYADNQRIWVADPAYDPEPRAFAVMDQWLLQWQADPQRGVLAARPALAQDSCFDAQGSLIASGETVWDGPWNGRPAGACTLIYPSYSVSRQVAGADVSGDLLKCQLQPVTQAIARGVYGPHEMTPYLRELQTIFPEGVCDYRLGDAGRPQDLWPTGLAAQVPSGATVSADLSTLAR